MSCNHMNCCQQNILLINLDILYIIHIKRSSRIQELSKSSSTSKFTYETILIILLNLLFICNIFEFKVTQNLR